MARARVAASGAEVSENSIAKRFEALLALIEPNDERMALAARLPELVREAVTQSSNLRTTVPHTLLVGSYRRHTAVGEIKDVDIAVIVAKDYADSAPKLVLDDLAAALEGARRRKRLRNIERHDQRRSVRCELPDDNFLIDLVPVIAVTSDPRGDLWIPDRDQRRWVPTRSIGYLEVFSQLNATSGHKLVRLVKVLKHWKNHQGIDRFQAKSFWIEALIVELVRDGKITFDGGWPEIAERAFRALYQRCLPVKNAGKGTPVVADPMILGANVAHNWKREGFETFFAKLDASRKATASALAADEAAAVAKWRKVFGKDFAPAWTDDLAPVGALAVLLLGGGALVLRNLLKRS